MQIEIVKILSGQYANFYTVKVDGDPQTLLEKFIIENQINYPGEVENIRNRISTMAKKTGAREQFFKLNEGVPGDGVCALYDDPEKELRLYCIRYGSLLVILGSGGEKPEGMITLQESPKLTAENYLLRKISQAVSKAIKNKDLVISSDGMDLECDDDQIIIDI